MIKLRHLVFRKVAQLAGEMWRHWGQIEICKDWLWNSHGPAVLRVQVLERTARGCGRQGSGRGAGVSVLGRGGQGATPSLPEAPRGGDVERDALNSAPASGSGPGQGSELPRAGWIWRGEVLIYPEAGKTLDRVPGEAVRAPWLPVFQRPLDNALITLML